MNHDKDPASDVDGEVGWGKEVDDYIAQELDSLSDQQKKTFRDFWEFRRLMKAESDRGCALMGASYVDDRLADLLKKKLLLNSDLRERMFDYIGPLGSFSARINMAYAIGLIPANLRRELHVMRDIRNVFAHRAAHLTFESPEISPLVDKLRLHFKEMSEPARPRFVTSTVGITAHLNGRLLAEDKFKAPADIDVEGAKIRLNQQVSLSLSQIIENRRKRPSS